MGEAIPSTSGQQVDQVTNVISETLYLNHTKEITKTKIVKKK